MENNEAIFNIRAIIGLISFALVVALILAVIVLNTLETRRKKERIIEIMKECRKIKSLKYENAQSNKLLYK